MHPIVSTVLVTSAIVVVLVLLLWIVATIRRDVSIADVFWGTGFAVVVWAAFIWNGASGARSILVLVLTTLWGLRLSLFLLWRNWGESEDRRYCAMRNRHGNRFWWVSLVTVFLLQGAILEFVSLPIQAVMSEMIPKSLGAMDVAGVALWCVGLLFETISDWQLAAFKLNPQNTGQVMDRGLWRYTRHPNYFGDFCVWWGIYVVAASGGAWWTIASPLLMSFLLLRVSGVTLLESNIRERRPRYADYQARTNVFFPGPPRRS